MWLQASPDLLYFTTDGPLVNPDSHSEHSEALSWASHGASTAELFLHAPERPPAGAHLQTSWGWDKCLWAERGHCTALAALLPESAEVTWLQGRVWHLEIQRSVHTQSKGPGTPTILWPATLTQKCYVLTDQLCWPQTRHWLFWGSDSQSINEGTEPLKDPSISKIPKLEPTTQSFK